MLVREITDNYHDPLFTTSTVGDALASLREHDMLFYPIVVQDTQLLAGQASLDDIRNYHTDESAIVNTGSGYGLVLKSSSHVLEATHIMLMNKRKSLPVIDDAGRYAGILTKDVLISSIVKLLNLNEPGTVIMIELKPRDFMLSDIIRIIESEGARILNLTTQSPDAVNDNYRISVKLNLDDLSRVGSALRRYGYLISVESASELNDTDMSDKADAFLRFLDI
ncbi:MAG: CBS domain-containing protein [Balneolales bacterium]|nr:CBS domain-containing protein [Balneolales bacterium]